VKVIFMKQLTYGRRLQFFHKRAMEIFKIDEAKNKHPEDIQYREKALSVGDSYFEIHRPLRCAAIFDISEHLHLIKANRI
jgi:hypothetical protein